MPLATREVVSLAPSRRAPAQAREAVRQFARATVGGEAIDTAELLVSELVTNAVNHGRGTIKVLMEYGAGGFVVTVCDDEPSQPQMPPERPLALGGRGLRMVDSLADEWGVRSDGASPGKGVWFRLS